MRGITKDFLRGSCALRGRLLAATRARSTPSSGQNGAGKSTLMKVLGGVYPDYSGRSAWAASRSTCRSPRDALAARRRGHLPGVRTRARDDGGREHRPGAGARAAPRPHRARRIREDAVAEIERLGIDLPVDTPVSSWAWPISSSPRSSRPSSRAPASWSWTSPRRASRGTERDRLFEAVRDLRERPASASSTSATSSRRSSRSPTT